MDYDNITKPIAVVTAVLSALGGGYAFIDKTGLMKKDILKWDAEHFSISNGPAHEPFRVIVARQKIRDDCLVDDFTLEVRDTNYIVHKAIPSVAKFSGPASPTVDKFGYTMIIEDPQNVTPGEAKLIARIVYKCPEGSVVISYPNHINLTFTVTEK